ncbi:hypothetical protein SAMN05216403_103177 [Nitrosospira multiformis ATCC 25196]|uniref:Uncharacterized protein n=1 Tax=Nitrosospira multiformis (strain ATCC 25196 / NCIMB 11849 / C 71) TaxID=323848 RepID=A0A1H5T3C1_NITMU|nr:hypothetical protein SAMN05216411_107181 [Nitrosospira multiformis]SEF56537.1 hypothetical protein SAMN05216403_103177 [Nitrosospira multiformis ATCC 25196]
MIQFMRPDHAADFEEQDINPGMKFTLFAF